MSLPTRVQYNEAILGARVRLKIPDPNIKEGYVETVVSQAGMKSPWGMEGGFAIVYRYRTRSGHLRALRCFKTQIDADMQERYACIGPYFRQHIPDISANFTYHDPGITVRLTDSTPVTYPLIEMEWIEGETLLEYVDALCRQQNRTALAQLITQWDALIQAMRAATIAHGDLSGSNVMVQPHGQLVLVDYDGVYVPALAEKRSITSGQPDYQHPQVAHRPFNERMDDFSAMVIRTALLALSICPDLWHDHTHRNNGQLFNENILFRAEDFVHPDSSAMFRTLKELGHPELQEAIKALAEMCRPDYYPPPPSAPPPPPTDCDLALKCFRMAAYQKNARKMVTDCDSAFLETCPEMLESERRLLAEAHRYIAMVDAIRYAIQTNDDAKIVMSYDRVLAEKFADFNAYEQKRIQKALAKTGEFSVLQNWKKVLKTNNDKNITEFYDSHIAPLQLPLEPVDQERLNLAQKRLAALVRFRAALGSDDHQRIVAAYAPILDTYPEVSSDEWQRLKLARLWVAFEDAVTHEEDRVIVERGKDLARGKPLNSSQQKEVDRAQHRLAALERWRKALQTNNNRHIVATYDPILDDCTSITQSERQRLEQVRTQLKKNRTKKPVSIAFSVIMLLILIGTVILYINGYIPTDILWPFFEDRIPLAYNAMENILAKAVLFL